MCDVETIEAVAKKHNLKAIYDAAHAFAVKYKGVSSANFGDASMFSFHATKVFNTIEGGAVCFADDVLIDTLNDMKNFGIRGPERVVFAGGNAKMNEFQAAMGVCNLRHLDREIAKRKAVTERYRQHLEGIKGIRLCNIYTGKELTKTGCIIPFSRMNTNRITNANYERLLSKNTAILARFKKRS